jgi:hypothetical protein
MARSRRDRADSLYTCIHAGLRNGQERSADRTTRAEWILSPRPAAAAHASLESLDQRE